MGYWSKKIFWVLLKITYHYHAVRSHLGSRSQVIPLGRRMFDTYAASPQSGGGIGLLFALVLAALAWCLGCCCGALAGIGAQRYYLPGYRPEPQGQARLARYSLKGS